jgi:hypothetical protein
MSVAFGNGITVIYSFWTAFKAIVIAKSLSMQYQDDGTITTVFAFDGPLVYSAIMYDGTIPYGVLPVYSQAQNNADLLDFQNNWLPTANGQLDAVVNTGNLGALNATVQIAMSGAQSVGVQIAAGTFIGSIIPEISFDGGTSWNQTLFSTIGNGNKIGAVNYLSANFALGITILINGGVGLVRIRVFTYTSGSCNVTLRASNINDQSLALFVAQPGSALPPSLAITGGSVTTAAPTYTTGLVNAMSLNTSGGLRVDGSGVTQPISGTVATTAPALTKGTQGTNGWPVQELKDAGRVIKTYVATAVAGVTSEALLTLTPYADLVAGATGTSFAVTAGKRLRLQSIILTWRNNTTAAGGVTIRFRTNASGAAIVSSPVQFAINATTSLATIGSGITSTFIFPDGFELSSAMQFAVTQLAVTAVIGLEVSICAYEY